MTHAPGCPYAGFDAAAHARECGECDRVQLEERCQCSTTSTTASTAGGTSGANGLTAAIAGMSGPARKALKPTLPGRVDSSTNGLMHRSDEHAPRVQT